MLITTQRFLQAKINWTSYKKIKDGHKILDNSENIYKKIFFRFIYTLCYKNISKYFIININQIDMILVFSSNDNIYKRIGVKQVPIYRKEEKKIFIIILSFDLDDKVIPI